MELNRGNRDLVLAHTIGYHCGKGEGPQFEFPNCDKAWNEYWPYIRDEARNKGWGIPSRDAVEREFRRGWGKAINEKHKRETDGSLA